MATPTLQSLALSDSEEDNTSELFASPSRAARNKSISNSKAQDGPLQPKSESKYDAEAAREAALKRELEGVRNINEVIEGVLSSLEVAKGNMDVSFHLQFINSTLLECKINMKDMSFMLTQLCKQTVSRTVTNASTLLNTWTSILSQTEHNQRLLLNPNWKGASADIADIENEQVLKAQAAERRVAEEERRREEAKRRAEEEERQRQAGTATVTRGGGGTGRGRVSASSGRGRVAGSGLSSSGYVAGGSRPGSSIGSGRGGIPTPGSTSSRGSSGVGRGVGRGRARGVPK